MSNSNTDVSSFAFQLSADEVVALYTELCSMNTAATHISTVRRRLKELLVSELRDSAAVKNNSVLKRFVKNTKINAYIKKEMERISALQLSERLDNLLAEADNSQSQQKASANADKLNLEKDDRRDTQSCELREAHLADENVELEFDDDKDNHFSELREYPRKTKMTPAAPVIPRLNRRTARQRAYSV